MQLHDLVATSQRVAADRSRKHKIEQLAELLRRLAPEEVTPAVSWLGGVLTQGRIGVGPAAVREAATVTPAPQPSLGVAEVDTSFSALAALSGAGSTRARLEGLRQLFARATVEEQRFLARLLLGDLRQGALEGVMQDAVATAAAVPLDRLRRAAMVAGDLTAVSVVALAEGAAGLDRFALELFRPLQPMLAQPSDDLEASFADLGGEATVELKLDGARIQVHKDGDEVRLYTRRLHEVTAAVPELVDVARALPAGRLVLDGEAIALRDDGSPHPFQVTMSRFGSRLDSERLSRDLPLVPFFFDLLHVDGKDLLDQPQGQRLQTLVELAPETLVVPHRITADAAVAAAFLDDAVRRGHEGIMIKDRTAGYEAGRRGRAWLKVKPTHTLDLVILAAEWGHGRRRGWLSNLHLGARDPESGDFVMLGKTFKGLTDRMLEWQTAALLERELGREGNVVHVRPELVAEIVFNDVQSSPRYPAGLALRFARVKAYRPDKTAAEADAIETVRRIYRQATGLPVPG